MSLPDDTTGPRVPLTAEGHEPLTTEPGSRAPATETGRTPTDPPVLPGGGTVMDPPGPSRRTGDGESYWNQGDSKGDD